MGTEFPWKWGRGMISANLDVIWGMSDECSEKREITRYETGDCVFVVPYLVHESVGNTGNAIRWTAVVKIDDASGQTHVKDGIHPFDIDEYIDSRSNEERLN